MSYCLNPSCPKPVNHPKSKLCRACGSKLLLRDRYHLVKGLGKGGFGATFLAADMSLPGKPLCVIKQLRPNTDNPNFLSMARQLFEREAKTLGRIGNHPQIPRLLDYFEDRNQFYLVQEFVKGNTLQQEVKKTGIFDEAKARQVLKEILAILKDIHAQKVIHRDIKPANIIRREVDNRLVLIDFGVVKNQVNTFAANNSEQTALTAFAVGTPGFAPPEQLAMRPVYASDIYALGVTCMYLLTGKAPKKMDSDPITGEIDWFKYVKVSDSFADMLETMLEVSVRNRYKTADEVLQVLDMEGHIDSLAESMIGGSIIAQPNTSLSGRQGYRSNSWSSRSRTYSKSSYGNRTRSSRSSVSSVYRRNSLRSRNYDRTASRSFSGNTPSRRSTSARVGSTRANSTREIKKPVKLDGQTLLSYYSKGRRDFVHKDVSSENLQKANLSAAKFHYCRLIKVNLYGADLTSSDFSGSDFRQANLRNANLYKAYLTSTNLEGTDLRGADLSNADLSGAKLKGANLCGANLISANISEEQLSEAKTNWTTIMPNGKRGFW